MCAHSAGCRTYEKGHPVDGDPLEPWWDVVLYGYDDMSGTLSWQGIVCKCGSHVCCTIECVTVRSELRVNNCIDYFTGHREVKRLLHHALYILCAVSGILTPYCHYRPWQQRTEGGHSSIVYSQTYSGGTFYRGTSQICLQCITNIHPVWLQFLYTIQANKVT